MMKWGNSDMENEMRLRAGEPDDDNRDYLPESIYHSRDILSGNPCPDPADFDCVKNQPKGVKDRK